MEGGKARGRRAVTSDTESGHCPPGAVIWVSAYLGVTQLTQSGKSTWESWSRKAAVGQNSTITAPVKLSMAHAESPADASRQNTDFRHWRHGTIQNTFISGGRPSRCNKQEPSSTGTSLSCMSRRSRSLRDEHCVSAALESLHLNTSSSRLSCPCSGSSCLS